MIAALIIVGTISEPGALSGPAGWTVVQQNTTGGLNDRVAVFQKIAGASESGSYVFTWANLASIGFWIFAEYKDGDSLQALDTSMGNQQNASGTSSIAPAVLPSPWNTYNTLLCVHGATLTVGTAMSMTTPIGMTMQAQSKSLTTAFPALMLSDLLLTSANSAGTKTATCILATTSLGVSFLVKQSVWAGVQLMGSNT